MKRVLSVFAALALACGLALINPSSASAAQDGLQSVTNQPTSWSSIWVYFACSLNGFSVPVGQTWGEGWANPGCGTYQYQNEPSSVYVGPGWCITRWIETPGYTYPKQYLGAGGSGHTFKLWQSTYNGLSYYVNHIEAWYGSWCPTSGGISVSGWGYEY